MKLREVNINTTSYPTLFYIGMGKTGSSSLFHGVKSHTIAHWHDTMYFCRIHNNYSLIKEGLNVYDFANDIGKDNDFEPIFIEAVRDPVAQRLSWYFQIFKNATAQQVIHAMQNDEWYFELNHFKEGMEVEIEPIILRFEDIHTWQMQLALHGITYEPIHTNKRSNTEYQKAKEKLRLPLQQLSRIYDSPAVCSYYSENEIEKFIEKWAI